MNRDNKFIGLSMEQLSMYLKTRFGQINAITESTDGTYFMVDFAADTQGLHLLVKEMDAFIKGYIAIHGNPEEAYGFNINCGGKLVNNIWYNDPTYGHRIEMQLKGRHQKLFIADVMGATGDYSVFNQDFEYLGDIYMFADQAEKDYGVFVRPDWNRVDRWRATTKLLQPHLAKIIAQVQRSMERKKVLKIVH